jgi:hypothetical protein
MDDNVWSNVLVTLSQLRLRAFWPRNLKVFPTIPGAAVVLAINGEILKIQDFVRE